MLKLCNITDINEGQAKGFKLEGQNILVVKHQGKPYIYRNLCPHRGVTLEWEPDQFLDDEKQFIQCATHSALFRIENGQCIQGPCLGDFLETIEHRQDGDTLWVDI